MRIINLTPHTINILKEDKSVLEVQSSGLARVHTKTEILPSIDGIAITAEARGGIVTGLPDPTPDTIFVVSRPVAAAVPEREDVFVPGNLIRNDQGQPIGCQGLARV